MTKLRTFQKRFIRGATAPGIDTAALSLPRGNGKSWLAGHLVARVLTPTDRLFRPGTESVLCAASIEQARIVFRFAREVLERTGEYRFLDASTRCGITHKSTNTKLRVIGSKASTAFGLVNCPWAICDEPGAWEVNGGTLLYDAIMTAMGKPGSPMRAVFIGTLAPAMNGWWHDLVAGGSRGSTFVQSLQGDPSKWGKWPEIRRCNPLSTFSVLRKKLLEERDEARADSRLKARFLSYRLNVPTGDESTMLLSVADWKRVCSREVGGPFGRPIVGVDLGGGRAWSAAVAIWRSGRVEAFAVAPGIPDLSAQEKRDRVPSSTYQKLVESGRLRVADGLRVQPVGLVVEQMLSLWGSPEVVVCDRFRLPELQDAGKAIKIVPRRSRWSEASEDIRALRKLAADGPLSCDTASRSLLTANLAGAIVRNDDQGSTRLVKKGTNNTARDDVAAALVLAAGALSRRLNRPVKAPLRYIGLAG